MRRTPHRFHAQTSTKVQDNSKTSYGWELCLRDTNIVAVCD